MRLVYIALAALLLAACGNKKTTESTATVDSLAIAYTVLKTLPHNTEAFTEGLTIHDGKVLESTGQNGKSWVAEVDPGSGVHTKKITLDNRYFGEGMTVLNSKLYYLTWQTKIGFIYDANSYKQIGEFNFETEGWGLTHDNKNLIMSDGTDKLYYLDTTTFKIVRKLSVTESGKGLKNLNELEYVDGYIFANVYETPTIVKIDPASGKVVGMLNLSVLVDEIKRMFPETEVMNGIAYDPNSKAMLVTGKNWPRTYLIRLQK
ncbi:MAG: glutaminyl-peptide cyclotransferase [Chryseolinea sp.]